MSLWKVKYSIELETVSGVTKYELKHFTNDTVVEKKLPLQQGSNFLKFQAAHEDIGLGWMSYSIILRLRNYTSDPILDELKIGSWRLEITMNGKSMPYLFPDFSQLDNSNGLINIFKINLYSTFELTFVDAMTLQGRDSYGSEKTAISASGNYLHVYSSGTDLGHVPITDLIGQFIYDEINGTEETPVYIKHGLYLEENLTPFEDPAVPYTPSSTGVSIFSNILIAPELFEEHVSNSTYKPTKIDVINFLSTLMYSQMGYSFELGGLFIRELGTSNYENTTVQKLNYASNGWRTYTNSTLNNHDLSTMVLLSTIDPVLKDQYLGMILRTKFGKSSLEINLESTSYDQNVEFNTVYDIEKSNDSADDVKSSKFGMSMRDFNEDFDLRPKNLKHLYTSETYTEIDRDYLEHYVRLNLIPDPPLPHFDRKGIKLKVNALIDPLIPFELNSEIYTITRGVIDTFRFTTTIEDSSYEPELDLS
jgi:hypothetical protein